MSQDDLRRDLRSAPEIDVVELTEGDIGSSIPWLRNYLSTRGVVLNPSSHLANAFEAMARYHRAARRFSACGHAVEARIAEKVSIRGVAHRGVRFDANDARAALEQLSRENPGS